MKLNFEEINANVLSRYPNILSQWLPGGRVYGHEYKCGGLAGGKGESLSVNITTGRWADFATDDRGGDPISLYAAIKRIGQADAARILGGGEHEPHTPSHKAAAQGRKTKNPEFRQITPAPEGVPNVRHPLGIPTRRWAYRSLDGGLIGYILRFDKADGKKEIIPLAYGEKGGKIGWHWKSFNDPRPLYNLPALKTKTDVLIVEGEKCADHAALLFPKMAVVSWPGGGKAIAKADWTPLKGRRVIIWPDADEPGIKTALAIADILRPLSCAIKFVQPPDNAPDGWDVADSDLKPETAMGWLKRHVCRALTTAPDVPESPPIEAYNDVMQDDGQEQPANEPPAIRRDFVLDDAPFKCLGHDKGTYYYFSQGTQQITALTAAQHTKSNLIQIASRFWWLSEFKKGKTDDFEVDAAADAMMRGCERVGIFNIERMRGRGAWWDDGRVAIHLGDRVILDGQTLHPAQVRSRYIYEASHSISLDNAPALNNREAHRYLQFIEMMPWAQPLYAKLAAGWCVVSHIGGVLHWRPHIWIVGPRGSGKSYVMSNVIKPALGENCIFVQSNTTEAGIRQTLGFDSLPVLFDEAEGESHEAHANIQRVLGLIRQSSSETGGRIAKGTPGGKAQRFMVRSCFALSSINAPIIQQSDKSRISVLHLSPHHRSFGFDEIKQAEAALLTPAYISGFYARAIRLAAVIRANGSVFAEAAATVLGEQRAGDQTGVLLAGAYSLHSDQLISYDRAVEWMKAQDWEQKKQELKGQKDEIDLFSFLLAQKLNVKLSTGGGSESLPIGYLIDVVREQEIHDGVPSKLARRVLQHNGFRVDDYAQGVWIANEHNAIREMLRNHKIKVNWNSTLKELPGSEPSKGAVYFSSKLDKSTAAIYIPFKWDN